MILADYSMLAVVSGVLAAAGLCAAPLFTSRTYLLGAQLLAGLAFSVHYAALGVMAASAVNILGCLQTIAAVFAIGSKTSTRIGYVLAVCMVLAGIAFWQGPVSALSVLAMAFIAFGRMQSSQGPLRVLLIAGGAFWLTHDVIVAAWIAVAADVLCLVAGIFGLTLYWMRAARRPTPTRGLAPA